MPGSTHTWPELQGGYLRLWWMPRTALSPPHRLSLNAKNLPFSCPKAPLSGQKVLKIGSSVTIFVSSTFFVSRIVTPNLALTY